MGFPVVILTTRGAKTGRDVRPPLAASKMAPDSWLVVASRTFQ